MKLSTKKHLKSAVDTFVASFITVFLAVIATFDVNSIASMDRTALVAVSLGVFASLIRALIKPAHAFIIGVLTGVKGEFTENVPPQKFKLNDTVIEASVKDGHIKAKKVIKKPTAKKK